MNNSSKYRKPPLRRTRDSFIDDKNSIQNPRYDLGQMRHLQVRRDKDTTRNMGITLYDVDFAIKSFIDQKIQLAVEDNGESIPVPTIYANPEKWASIQKDGYLKDKKGKTITPLITFRRSNVAINSVLRRNKVATINQIAFIMKQKYNKSTPYDKFSTQYDAKKPAEYFMTPMPDYVDVSYDFIVWCDYQSQLNFIVENFIFFNGQSFGDKNFFKFSTFMDSIAMEDSNTTGQDRVVRASFQLLVHAYLLPKNIASQMTTTRLVTANKIVFVSEAFSDINTIAAKDRQEIMENNEEFGSINTDETPRALPPGQTAAGFKRLNSRSTEELLKYYQQKAQQLANNPAFKKQTDLFGKGQFGGGKFAGRDLDAAKQSGDFEIVDFEIATDNRNLPNDNSGISQENIDKFTKSPGVKTHEVDNTKTPK